MSDSDEKTTDKTLRVGAPGKLSLNKSLESNRIKQSFSHGRSKTVTVEVRKTRTVQRDESGKIVEVSRANPAAAVKQREEASVQQTVERAAPVDKKEAIILTSEERELRRKVLERAHVNKEKEDKKRQEDRRSIEEVRKLTAEQRASEAALADVPVGDEEKPAAEVRKEKERVRKKELEDFEDNSAAKSSKKGTSKKRRRHGGDGYDDINLDDIELYKPVEEEDADIISPALQAILDEGDEFEDYTQDESAETEDESIVAATKKVEDDRAKTVRLINSSERVIMAAVDPNKIKKYLRSEAPVMAPRRRNEPVKAQEPVVTERKVGIKRRGGKNMKRHVASAEVIAREVIIPENIVVADLANRMAVRSVDVIKSLMKMGMMVTQNESIDADTAELIVTELGHKPVRVSASDVENVLEVNVEDSAADLKPRAPVVTVMGHVDHGKTSLLDAIRSSNVVSGESGGITQHIGAYMVALPDGHKITFIDTPGHEAFTAMRARGASVTDIVVLVVAADDGIKQQTVEAINHAKAAGVPIIVAVNKMDKPGADPMRVRNELMTHELVTEEYGGDVIAVDVSAKERTNIDKLLESIMVQAEVMELKSNPDAMASGTVIESRIDKGRGVVATVLVQRGTLRVGDIIIAGSSFGYARALINEHGQNLKEAGPATPVEVLGLNVAPSAGDNFAVAPTERDAREITDFRSNKDKEQKNASERRLSLDDLFTDGKAKVKELPVIVKGDVNGSVEAIAGSLEKIDSNEVKAKVIHSGVGAITESDVVLARASNAIILGFNVRANTQAKDLAAREKIDIRYYSIIYDLVDDVKKALSGMLAPEFKENLLGYAEIRQVFNITKVGKVAGTMVTQGLIKRSARARLLRDNVVIHEGVLKTLRRFKDDVKEVKEGFECGIAFENYDDIREGDTIEAFDLEQVTRSI